MNDPRRLRRILEVKERVRDMRRSALAAADRELDGARRQADEAAHAMDGAAGALGEGGELAGSALRTRAELADMARGGVERAARDVEAREQAREESRREVEVASRDVRALERAAARLERSLAERRDRHERHGIDDLVAGRANARRERS